PRVAQQQRRGEDAGDHRVLAPVPGAPGRDEQSEQEQAVEADPGGVPGALRVVVGQHQGQVDDPRDEHHEPAGDDGQKQLAHVPQLGVFQRWQSGCREIFLVHVFDRRTRRTGRLGNRLVTAGNPNQGYASFEQRPQQRGTGGIVMVGRGRKTWAKAALCAAALATPLAVSGCQSSTSASGSTGAPAAGASSSAVSGASGGTNAGASSSSSGPTSGT